MLTTKRVSGAFVAVVALAAAVLVTGQTSPQPDVGRAANLPLVSLTGAHSKVEVPAIHRVLDRAAWLKLWLQHAGRKDEWELHYEHALPEINFDQCMVIVIFGGKTNNSAGINAHSYEDVNGTMRLRVAHRSYQTMERIDTNTPFGVFIVPRSEKPVVVEQDARSLINEPPVWKEKARFEAVDTAAPR